MYSDSTIPTSLFTATSELLPLPPDNTIASGEASLAPVRAMPGSERDWLIQNQACGGKCSELSLKLDPALLLSKIQKACSSGEVEKSLPLSEWQDIVSKSRSSYRQRKLEHSTKETESLSSLSFRTLHSSNTSTNSNPAGLTKCEQSLRKLGIISPSHYLSTAGMELIFGFPLGWTDCLSTKTSLSPTLKQRAEPKVEFEPDTSLPKQSCPDKLTLLSKDCSTSPTLSELSISDCPPPALSGLRISFGTTLQYLTCKTVTRRNWKDSHAKKFIKAFEQNKLIKALNKDIRYGGKQIGWCRLLCAPYKEQLATMPEEDLQAEGGMCSSVEEFVKRYFKGNSSLEVWVVRFQFIELEEAVPAPTFPSLGVYSESVTKPNSNSALTSLAVSIHQTQLSDFGIYADSANKINIYPLILSATQSIHQASFNFLGVYSGSQQKANSYFPFSLSIDNIRQASPEPRKSFGVYSESVSKHDRYSFLASAKKSIQQASFTTLGVYSDPGSETDRYPLIAPAIESIHQASFTPLGVYADCGSKTNKYSFSPSATKSIHQASFTTLGVYSAIQYQTNSYSPFSLLTDSIHQASFTPLGVYSVIQHKTNSYFPLYQSIDSIHQAPPEPRKSFGVYSNDSNPSNSNDPVRTTTESVEPPSASASVEHQTSPGVYQSSGNEVNINTATSLQNASIHQDCLSSFGVYSNSHNQTNTNSPNNSLAESIHQAQSVQGGNGLVYSFWKGESIVNHYRYKVKVNGKWKVKSVYIPVGKLPKVREAITNNLGVTAIVTEILNRKL